MPQAQEASPVESPVAQDPAVAAMPLDEAPVVDEGRLPDAAHESGNVLSAAESDAVLEARSPTDTHVPSDPHAVTVVLANAQPQVV